jgi:hypothetical protein
VGPGLRIRDQTPHTRNRCIDVCSDIECHSHLQFICHRVLAFRCGTTDRKVNPGRFPIIPRKIHTVNLPDPSRGLRFRVRYGWMPR